MNLWQQRPRAHNSSESASAGVIPEALGYFREKERLQLQHSRRLSAALTSGLHQHMEKVRGAISTLKRTKDSSRGFQQLKALSDGVDAASYPPNRALTTMAHR